MCLTEIDSQMTINAVASLINRLSAPSANGP
jgi:hypothetical protein